MAKTSGRTRGRIASRLAAAAITAALVATGASAVAAENPAKSAKDGAAKAHAPAGLRSSAVADTTRNALYGFASNGYLYSYAPDGKGGLSDRVKSGENWSNEKDLTQVDHNGDGHSDGVWYRSADGYLRYFMWDIGEFTVGGGWNTYNHIWSVGNLGGAGAGDLLARDGSGNLYIYLGYGDGKLTSRYKVGGGWGQYNQIAGNGDLTGDGKADIVARDGSGNLWLYKGTGNYKAPFEGRTKIGGGWDTYNTLISTGDVDYDGKTDLIARGNDGSLWRYSGTGNASSPYKSRVKIGNGGWNTYRLLF
ncbi:MULTISPECIES: FG-GAP repeat domain-containing protein [unclassified Streptomyces]|uniref:VCBS repeat-containing protein n=1 Tax=Streptomyces sp. NBC_00060 TaxID=2975636 RepID=A0AAU2GVC0_9ACTN